MCFRFFVCKYLVYGQTCTITIIICTYYILNPINNKIFKECFRMHITEALKIIQTVRQYQKNYDECPNVSLKPASVRCNHSDFLLAGKPTGFFSNGGILWFICLMLTIDFAICSIMSIASYHIIGFIFGLLGIGILTFLVGWLIKIISKIKSIKKATAKVTQFNKETYNNKIIYNTQIAAERERIKAECNDYMKRNNVPNWMHNYCKGINTSFKSDISKQTYTMSNDTIRNLYYNRYSTKTYMNVLDPLWIISPKYATDELIYISEKNPSITTYAELHKVYVNFDELKKEFFSLVRQEFSKYQNSILDQEAKWEFKEMQNRAIINQLEKGNELQKEANKLAEQELEIMRHREYLRRLGR